MHIASNKNVIERNSLWLKVSDFIFSDSLWLPCIKCCMVVLSPALHVWLIPGTLEVSHSCGGWEEKRKRDQDSDRQSRDSLTKQNHGFVTQESNSNLITVFAVVIPYF